MRSVLIRKINKLFIILFIFLSNSFQSAFSEIKVGLSFGFSGPIESLAPHMAESAELAFKEASESGLFLNGKTITGIRIDTTCTNSESAVVAAKDIASKGVVAIIGGVCPGITKAIVEQVSGPDGIVMISPGSNDINLIDLKYNNFFFRNTPSTARISQVLADMTKDKKIESVAITYSNDENGKNIENFFKKALEAHGIKVTISLAHENNKEDYSSEVAALASAGGNAMAIIGYPYQGGKGIIQATIDSGAFNKFILSEEMIDQSLLNIFGKDMNKSFGIVAGSLGKAGILFEKISKQNGIDSSSPFTRESYDAAALIILSIQAGKSSNREIIAKNILNIANYPGKKIYPGELKKGLDLLAKGKQINYEGASKLEFSENGELIGSFLEKEVRNGKFKTLKQR